MLGLVTLVDVMITSSSPPFSVFANREALPHWSATPIAHAAELSLNLEGDSTSMSLSESTPSSDRFSLDDASALDIVMSTTSLARLQGEPTTMAALFTLFLMLQAVDTVAGIGESSWPIRVKRSRGAWSLLCGLRYLPFHCAVCYNIMALYGV